MQDQNAPAKTSDIITLNPTEVSDAKPQTALVPYEMPQLPVIKLDFQQVREYIAPSNATDAEVQAFILIAEHCGLDPWKREIYLAKPGGKAIYMTGYQVYLERAEMSGLLEDWHVDVDDYEKPTMATGYIKRRDREQPFKWTVIRKEVAFAPKSGGGTFERPSHRNQPVFQLIKCWMSQAFRICFPVLCGGIPYIPEELPQTHSTTSEDLEATNGDATNDLTAAPAIPAAHADELPAEEPVFDHEFWTRKYYASWDPDRDTGELKYPHVYAYFKNEENRHKWQDTINPGLPSTKQWTLEIYFERALDGLPILEKQLKEGAKVEAPPDAPPLADQIRTAATFAEMSDEYLRHFIETHFALFTTDEAGNPIQSDDRAWEPEHLLPEQQKKCLEELASLKAIYQTIGDLTKKGIDKLHLIWYLKSRYLVPYLMPNQDLRALLAQAIGRPAQLAKLRSASKAVVEWVDWIGGPESFDHFLLTVHDYLVSLGDPALAARIMELFFDRMGVQLTNGLYRLSDIKPNDWESWPDVLAAVSEEAGCFVPFIPPEPETTQDDQPNEDDIPADDDIPF